LSKTNTPLKIDELMGRIVAAGLFVPAGQTPARSLYSVIYRQNQRNIEDGQEPLFVIRKNILGDTCYSLRKA